MRWGTLAHVAFVMACSGGDKPVDLTDESTTEPTLTGDTGPVEVTVAYLGPLFASGSRLQARSMGVPGSNERVFAYFFDTKLEVPCAFDYATDGVLRCLPIVDRLVSDSAFTDPDCTVPTLAITCGDSPYGHIRRPAETDPCDPVQEVVEIRELTPVAAPNGVYVSDIIAGCVPAADAAPVVAGELGEVVDAAQFVGATVAMRPAEDGIGAREIRADDGAMVRQGLFMEAAGDCEMRYIDGIGPRCVPEAAGVGQTTGDSWWWDSDSCDGGEIAFIPDDACRKSDPIVAIEFEAEGTLGLWEIGPPWDQPVVWDSTGGLCVETEVTATPWTFYSITGPATASTLPELSLVVSDDDPVGFAWFQTPSELRVEPAFAERRFGQSAGGPFQLANGDFCSGVAAADGTTRCLSTETVRIDDVSLRYYADAACTDPIAVVRGQEAPPDNIALFQRNVCGVTAPTSEPSVLVDVWRIGEPYTGAELHVSLTTGCQAVERQPSFRYFALEDSILDSLPLLSLQ